MDEYTFVFLTITPAAVPQNSPLRTQIDRLTDCAMVHTHLIQDVTIPVHCSIMMQVTCTFSLPAQVLAFTTKNTLTVTHTAVWAVNFRHSDPVTENFMSVFLTSPVLLLTQTTQHAATQSYMETWQEASVSSSLNINRIQLPLFTHIAMWTDFTYSAVNVKHMHTQLCEHEFTRLHEQPSLSSAHFEYIHTEPRSSVIMCEQVNLFYLKVF